MQPDARTVQAMAAAALHRAVHVSPVSEGRSTFVYRLTWHGGTAYLRVLPEEGSTFAPEAAVHVLLRDAGLPVPEVLYSDDLDPELGLAVMITAEIPGTSLAHGMPDGTLPTVVRAAGRDLALINRVPVDGFGWIQRETPDDTRLRGEFTEEREFMLADMESSLVALRREAPELIDVAALRAVIDTNRALLDATHATLAHGDFDCTHIFADGRRYSGLIDFGEIRGTGPYYDLGHFRFHDGETIPRALFPHLLQGYAEVTPLPPDADRVIAFNSLLIGIGFLARAYAHIPPRNRRHAIEAVHRDLRVLR
jgi:aminoglycoside phosphotransferase (APT) family kinase protein